MLPIAPERRRDRRHHVMGHARLRACGASGPELFGGIVDVSAGGVRLRVRPGVPIEPGSVYVVELEVAVSESRWPVAPVRLEGRGTAVRVDANDAPRGAEVALRFEGPLLVGDGFAAVAPELVRS